MPANFDLIIQPILANEGEYAWRSSDRGGETYCGISRVYWPHWSGWDVVDQAKKTVGISAIDPPSDLVKQLNVLLRSNPVVGGLVKDFYYNNFFMPLRLILLDSNRVAFKVLDIAVNMGLADAARFLQEAVGVTVDGIVGPVTASATNQSDPATVVEKLCSSQEKHYREIVAEHPDQEVNLENWLKRALETGFQFA